MKLQLCQLPKPLLSGRNLCLVHVAVFTIERKSWIRREGMLISEVNFHTPICTLFLLPSPPPLSYLPSLRIHHNYRRPTVLLLDDNMALRSMRYEYYQMARKCKSPPPPFLPLPFPLPLHIDTVPVVVYLKRVLYFLLHPSSHLATCFCCILTCIQLMAHRY